MLDVDTLIKMVLTLLAAAAWALQILFAARRRRFRPDWSDPVDKWSAEKFGIWWLARALIVLLITIVGIGFTLGSKGIFAGVFVLFFFSAAATLGDFFRSGI